MLILRLPKVRNFYPRSPCGERPPITFRHCTTYLFLSTLSLRRATRERLVQCFPDWHFYPRSPCGERLRQAFSYTEQHTYFYPRSPCGERQHENAGDMYQYQFLSTLSLRRATLSNEKGGRVYEHFYPRSPCGERLMHALIFAHSVLFLSTLSLRRATLRVLDGSKSSIISIHALLAESDPKF